MAALCCHRTRTEREGARTRSPSGSRGQTSLRGEVGSVPSSKSGARLPQLSVRTALASQAAGSTSDKGSHLPPPPSGAEQFMADVCGRSGGRQDAEQGQAGQLEQLRY